MRLKSDLSLRKVGTGYMIVNLSDPAVNVASVLSLNETAAEIWRQFQGRDFGRDDIVEWLCQHYEVEPLTAEADTDRLLESWTKGQVIVKNNE